MRDLFTTKKFHCLQKNSTGEVIGYWTKPTLDFKAKVVCKTCNEGWMSHLESQEAKPAMADLIVGSLDIPITRARANSIALFAFKTAVIIDHMRRADLFFSRSDRHTFASTLQIPNTVQMWFAGYLQMGSGRLTSLYHEPPMKTSSGLKLYVCTFGVGHLVFQTVAVKYSGPSISFVPQLGFERLAVPFWPDSPIGFAWPAGEVLRTRNQFEAFAERWGVIGPP
jgi:hypothetical protein